MIADESLILHTLNVRGGVVLVPQRKSDGYIYATELCRSEGRDFYEWWGLQSTQEYLIEFALASGIATAKLVENMRTGPEELRGLWVPFPVGLRVAQWCSPRLQVAMDGWLCAWFAEQDIGVTDLDC